MNNYRKIYFIRHGETSWNAERKFQGKTNTVLSKTGEKQAKMLAGHLKNERIDIIYTSPLTRAVQTAKPISDALSIEAVTVPLLKEIDFGRWEGLTIEEIKTKYAEEYEKSRENPLKHGFREGLSFDDVKHTAETFLQTYIMDGCYKNIAVVSHSVILKMLLIVSLDLPPESFHRFHLNNCSLTVVEITDHSRKLLKLGENLKCIQYR